MANWIVAHMQVCVALVTVFIATAMRVYGLPMDEVRWLVSPLLFIIGGKAFADVAAWNLNKKEK